MFNDMADIKSFLGEDSDIQEAWDVVDLLPLYDDLEGLF
jgi:hypothetical protein